MNVSSMPQSALISKIPDVLEESLESHGGLERWKSIQRIRAILESVDVHLALRLFHSRWENLEVKTSSAHPFTILYRFPEPDQQSVFTRTTTWIESSTGELLEKRTDPREAFGHLGHHLHWDPLDLTYFFGYTFWNFFTLPFLILQPGFRVSELPPQQEGDETFRRLNVLFPLGYPTHSRQQILSFGADGLLRRVEYSIDILGEAIPAVQHCLHYQRIDGVAFATRCEIERKRRMGLNHGPLLTFNVAELELQ